MSLTPSPVIRAFVAPAPTYAGMQLEWLTIAHFLKMDALGCLDALLGMTPSAPATSGIAHSPDEARVPEECALLCALTCLTYGAAEIIATNVPHASDPKWAETAARHPAQLPHIRAVLRTIFDDAFATYLPVKPPKESDAVTLYARQTLGLCAELLDFLMHEYHLGPLAARCLPMRQAFVLLAAAAQRKGCTFAAPDYHTQDVEGLTTNEH